MAPVIIDNEAKLQTLLAHISQCVRKDKDQLLFVDLEGVNLSRAGKVAIMQLLMPPSPVVFLVDIHLLAERAFNVAGEGGTSLGAVLGSPSIYKAFFDIRNDSEALHAHFGVSVGGIIDLQIIEYATRNPRGRFVHGLAKCIEKDLPYQPDWSFTKAKGRRLFAPEAGGSYEVFLERPIPKDIVTYCEQDVLLTPRLLAVYSPRLRPGLAAQLPTIVDERIALSKTATFNGKGRHMAIGPDLVAARAHSFTSTRSEMVLVQSVRLTHLCHLDASGVEAVINPFSTVDIGLQDGVSSISKSESTCDTSEISQESVSGGPMSETTATSASINSDEGATAEEADRDHYEHEEFERAGYSSPDDDSDSVRDFTACSADSCGYCGKCDY